MARRSAVNVHYRCKYYFCCLLRKCTVYYHLRCIFCSEKAVSFIRTCSFYNIYQRQSKPLTNEKESKNLYVQYRASHPKKSLLRASPTRNTARGHNTYVQTPRDPRCTYFLLATVSPPSFTWVIPRKYATWPSGVWRGAMYSWLEKVDPSLR